MVLVPSVLLLFVMWFLANRIFITILPGEAGVFWSRFFGGTRTDYVYPEGMHYIFPWDKMYIYNVRVQQVAHDFDVLSKNGLKIHLSISIRYFPQYDVLGLLHKRVGPDYVNKLVIPEIESVLRVIIGKITADQVYTTETPLIQEAVTEGIEQVAQRYVTIDDVVIKRIQLPPRVEEAIKYKLEQKHLAEAYEFKLQREAKEAERKRIEAEGIKTYNTIVTLSLSEQILHWKGLQATLELAKSPNAKVVVIGSGKGGLPLIGNIPIETFENISSVAIPKETGVSVPESEAISSDTAIEPDISETSSTREMTDNSGLNEF